MAQDSKDYNPIGLGLASGVVLGVAAGAVLGALRGDAGFWMGVGAGLGPGLGMFAGLFLAARPAKKTQGLNSHGAAMQTPTRVAASTPQAPRPQSS